MPQVVASVRRVAAVAACLFVSGGGLFAAEAAPGSPTAAFQAMWDAAKAGKREELLACFEAGTRKKLEELDKLLTSVAKELPEMGARGLVQEMTARAKETLLTLGQEKIEGDQATLEIAADGEKDTVYLVKEEGAWKIQIPLPDLSDIKRSVADSTAAMRELKKRAGELKKPDEPAKKEAEEPKANGEELKARMPADFSSPRAAWQSLWNAAKAGDRAATLACLTRDTQVRLQEIEKFMAERKNGLPPEMKVNSLAGMVWEKAKTATMEIGEAKIDDDEAKLKVKVAGREETILLAKEGDAWKVDVELPEADTIRRRIEDALKAGGAAEGEPKAK